MNRVFVNMLLRLMFGVIFGMAALSSINYFEINSTIGIMIVGYWSFSLAEGISDTISDRKKEKSDGME